MQKGDVVSIRSSYIYRGEKYAKTYIGGAFLVNRDLYEIISVNGDVAVIGLGEIPFAAVRGCQLVIQSTFYQNGITWDIFYRTDLRIRNIRYYPLRKTG